MILRSNRGFTVAGLLILMPLLVSLVTFCAAAMLLLNADAELKHECRSTLLKAQDEIAEDLETLMKLNETARSLRQARATAEAAVIVAVAPPAIAAAKAALAAIKANQELLAARQASLVFRAKAKSRSTPLKTKLKLHRTLRDKARLLENRNAALESRVRAATFDVVASPRDAITPDYHPSAGFTERQEMRVEAEWSVTSLLPAWLRQWLGRDDLKVKTTCRATIAKGTKGWRSLLKADKS